MRQMTYGGDGSEKISCEHRESSGLSPEALMRNSCRLSAFMLVVPFLQGCDLGNLTGCYQDCGGPPPPTQYNVIGYPRAWIDGLASPPNSGVRLTMHVGDTTTLYVVGAVTPPDYIASDTMRSVRWTIDSSGTNATASITRRNDGGGSLLALAAGSVIVNDGSYGGSGAACGMENNSYRCDFVGEIRVEPRATGAVRPIPVAQAR